MKKVSLLKRERINQLLSVVYNYPLTIVEAPIGFGKTTAVKSFLNAGRINSLWITYLRENESSSYFWDKFTSEWGKLDQEAAMSLKSLGFPANVPRFEKVIAILNEISLKKKTVMVIDDFHLSCDPLTSKFIMQLVAENIDNFHLIIATRNTTNLDFSEQQAKGFCYVLSQQSLKFSMEEISSYCKMMEDNISEENIKTISTYTDGWISLIYLVLIGMENGISIGMNNSIDELIEKVLYQSYDEKTKFFLAMLCIMNDFTAEQALFVTQEEKTVELLRKLNKENAFIYYDQITKTYKIHNVLMDFLRQRQQLQMEKLQRLYHRLGEWYLKHNDFPSAYSYFNRAGDTEQVLMLLNDPRNIRNELTLFEGSFELFEKIPQEMLNQYPIAYLQHVLLTIVNGNEETIMSCAEKLENLKKVYECKEGIDQEYRDRILAEILIINKFILFNHIDPDDDYNKNILKLLKGKQSYIMMRENEFTFGSPHLLYVYFRDQGTFEAIYKQAAASFTTYSQLADGCGAGSDYLLAAEYSIETGDWKSAETNSYKAIYKAQTKTQTSIIICAKFTLIRLFVFQGKITEAINLLSELKKEVLELNNPYYNTTIDMCKGYIYSCLNRSEKIPYWLQTGDMTEADLLYQGVAFNYIVYGKALMNSKNYIALDVLAESSKECFAIFSNQLGFLHNGIMEAVAKYHLHGMQEGLTTLQSTLSKAQEDHIVMPFVENAVHIIEMLKMIANMDINNTYIKKVYSLSKQYLKGLENSQIKKIKLSQREVEVLSLAADGMKREEIATRLTVSPGTVKTHLQNIYQKLEVSGKTTAVKVAKMHGLIE